MAYQCTSCEIRFEAAKPRCPKCLKLTPVIDLDNPRPPPDTFGGDDEPSFAGLRALITLAMLSVAALLAYVGVENETRLKAAHLTLGWFGGLLLYARFAIVFGFRIREFTGEDTRLTRRLVLITGAACFAMALVAGALLAGSFWLAHTLVDGDANPLMMIITSIVLFFIAGVGIVFLSARLPPRVRALLGLARPGGRNGER
jgi:hypothetical protein